MITFVTMEMMCNVRTVNLDVEREMYEKGGGADGDVWSGNLGYKGERETHMRCYGNQVAA